MRIRRATVSGYWALLLCVGPVHSSPAFAAPAATDTDPGSPQGDESYAAEAALGAQAFERGAFNEALGHFDAALARLEADADTTGGDDADHADTADASPRTSSRRERQQARATLHFNAAACLVELERYGEAELRFAEAASLDERQPGLATAQAGLAALAQGRTDAATRWLAAAEASLAASGASAEQASPTQAEAQDEELARAVAELRAGIAAARRAQRRSLAYVAATRAAALALETRNFAGALAAVERALSLADGRTASERAALHYSAGVAALEVGKLQAAREHALRALELNRRDAASYALLAKIDLARDEPEAAETYFDGARRDGVPREALEDGARVLAHNPLVPLPGFGGWLQVTSGFDSNPVQSGAGDASQLTDASGAGSPMLGAFGEIGYGAKLADRTVLRPFYSPEWLWLLAAAARENSVQAHELGMELHQGLGRSWLMTASLRGIGRWTGSDLAEVLSSEAWAGLELAHRWSKAHDSRLELRGGWVEGDGRWTYLSGPRWEARMAHERHGDDTELGVSAAIRYEGWGTEHLAVSGQDYPACTRGRCAGATYEIPLAYTAPRLETWASWRPTQRLTLSVRGGYEYRRYAAESYISRLVSDSRKLRQDHRFRAGCRGEWQLDGADHWRLFGAYRWLSNASNMAYDPADPAHDLDYADRTFDQHVVEGGVILNF